MENYWQRTAQQVARDLGTDLARGLSGEEARRRLAEHGPNRLEAQAGESALHLFLSQFGNFIIWVLIVAAVISGVLREWVDTFAILGIVLLNALLGFFQEYRAEKALAALRRLASPVSRVIRDGRLEAVPSAQLVPGDLVELEAGDHVPADGRILSQSANFAVEEASLTGESTPVAKIAEALEAEQVPLAERVNMVFMGTAIVTGKARVVMAATGMRTELGRIAGMIQGGKTETTPLQKKLDEFGRLIVRICVALVLIVFALEWWRRGWSIEILLTAVSLAVAAIPEGLPAVVTIALALGVQRMVRRHVLIRKLPSVETLGCATVICSDKTGTLTKNEMTVREVYAGGRQFQVTGVGYAPRGEWRFRGQTVRADEFPDLRRTLAAGALCNAANLIEEGDGFRVVGDPTEGALLICAAKAGLHKAALEAEYPFVEEIPFDSVRKAMSMVRRAPDGGIQVFVKGAPDVLLDYCDFIEQDGVRRPFTAQDRAAISRVNAELANQALRVLAVAARVLDRAPASIVAETLERELTFLGLVAMIDPPRAEAREAIRTCAAAGVRAVMITGDHKNTAVAVGRELGLLSHGDQALSGEELDALDDAALAGRIAHIPIYARVAPEHKLRIVRAWRRRGDIVAMTGDGVNDAPAVKEADIGVAMGITGTDVTKEVSDMIVTDDNFASIVAAVEEGRGIYDNILKFVHYLLSCNAGEILVMFMASLVGMPVPLLPIHILWVNIVTDGLPALALGVDPVDPNVMKAPPRATDESVVSQRRGSIMALQGLFIALCTLAAFAFVLFVEQEGLARARTAAFMVLACSQLFHAFNCRSMTASIFTLGFFTNSKLVGAALISFALQVTVGVVPFLQTVFKTAPLTAGDWIMVVAVASFPLWMMEIVKWMGRRRA
jgi:Ca2+-transporting ATPase